jgi:four helix bundle protein
MATVKRYDELIAWQKAIDLTQAIYAATAQLPREEVYGLSAQMRKSAVSIPSNIAEGQGRRSTAEFLHYLSIAHGSLRELETQVVIAGRLGYMKPNLVEELAGKCAEVGRLLNGLTNALAGKQR